MAKLTSQGRQDVFRGRPRDAVLSCLAVTNSYWQLCGGHLIILITSKEHLYRTLDRDRERELITKRKTAKTILKVP